MRVVRKWLTYQNEQIYVINNNCTLEGSSLKHVIVFCLNFNKRRNLIGIF